MFQINQRGLYGGLSLKKLLMLMCLASASLLSLSLSHAQKQSTPGTKPGAKEVVRLKENPTISDCNDWLDKNEAYLSQICRDMEIRRSIGSCFDIDWQEPLKSIYTYSCTVFTDDNGNQSAPLYFVTEKTKLLNKQQEVLNKIAKETNQRLLKSMTAMHEALDQEIKYLNGIIAKMDESCSDLNLQRRRARERSHALELLCQSEYDQNKKRD